MPRSEDIERFTQVLNSLGDEPAIRAARSETIEEVPAPGEGPAPAEEPCAQKLTTGESGCPGESENLQDLFESLSGLPEEARRFRKPTRAARSSPRQRADRRGQNPRERAWISLRCSGSKPPPEGIEELDRPAPARRARG